MILSFEGGNFSLFRGNMTTLRLGNIVRGWFAKERAPPRGKGFSL